MTDIERMALQAGMLRDGESWFTADSGNYHQDVSTEALTRFAELVRAQERERCANVAKGAQHLPNDGKDFANGWCSAALQIAQAIRALKGTP
jgi:hypothetical protein